jgi:NADH-quinone oxidoreductase subunit M
MAALVLFGFYPAPLLDVANPTVYSLLEHVGVSDDEPTVPAADHAEEGEH